jgi:two-component system response regulator LytT
MENQSKYSAILDAKILEKNEYLLMPFLKVDVLKTLEKLQEYKELYQKNSHSDLENLSELLKLPGTKNSFLVAKNNKYKTIPTENIAYFRINLESPEIVCFNGEVYFLNNSLDHIQSLIDNKQFFRINRQYLINFSAIKEVEHYFARKLLVKFTISAEDKFIVSKERANEFLNWMDNR